MALIAPFHGYRYNLKRIPRLADVISPPYDIISPSHRQTLYERSPFNIVRLELGEDLPGDNETVNKYTRARDYLENWVRDSVLVRDARESIYLHRMSYTLDGTRRTVTGIVCLVRLREFSLGEILPHEHTLSGPKLDRLALMRACKANISPILGLYSDPTMLVGQNIFPAIARGSSIDRTTSAPDTGGGFTAGISDVKGLSTEGRGLSPAQDITPGSPITAIDEAGVLHEFYVIQDEAIISRVKEMLLPKQIFIADGHHRYETALVLRNEERARDHSGAGVKDTDRLAPYDYVMMTLVNMDEEGLAILPTHRMVRGIGNFQLDSFLDRVSTSFDVEPVSSTELKQVLRMQADRGKHALGFYWGASRETFSLTLKDEELIDEALKGKACEAWRHLDVTILHTLIFERILGISSEDASRGTNITYTRDDSEAFLRTAAGEFQAAFFLNPTRMEEIRDVALAGEKMPQKSTYFFPKLPAGLVIYRF